MSWPPPRSSSLPGQSSVLADLLSHRDQVLGAAWSFHRRWRPLFCALGTPCCWLCSRRVSPRCFPYSIPRPESHVIFLAAFRVHWGTLGMYGFPPSCRRIGGGPSRRGPFLSRTLIAPPPLTGVGVVHGPSPSLLVVFPVLLCCGKVLSVSPVSGSQSALNSVLALQDLVRTFYCGIFCVP